MMTIYTYDVNNPECQAVKALLDFQGIGYTVINNPQFVLISTGRPCVVVKYQSSTFHGYWELVQGFQKQGIVRI